MSNSRSNTLASVSRSIAPDRILFAMLRVADLEASIAFYSNMLGMTELGRETFTEARFTAVYMGYDDPAANTALELTHNWDNDGYEHGTAFGNVSLAVNDIYALQNYLQGQGVTILRPAGDLSIIPAETGKKYTLAHIADPDGYRIELIQT